MRGHSGRSGGPLLVAWAQVCVCVCVLDFALPLAMAGQSLVLSALAVARWVLFCAARRGERAPSPLAAGMSVEGFPVASAFRPVIRRWVAA